jgi:diguanylate cyclase (GGDEF)-like protein/PAS domain S-box-containing protein
LPDDDAIDHAQGSLDAWSVLDAVGEAVSVHDPAGCLVYANAASRALLQDLRERMDGRPVGSVAWSAVRPDGSSVAACELPVEVARTAGTTIRDEVVGFPAADGGVRWLRITARPVAATPAPCTVVATFTDVTASFEARRQRDRTAAEHRALLDGLFEGVVSQDANGTIVASNPAAAKTLGLTQAELEGRASIDPRWRAVHEDGTPWPGSTHPAMEALRTGRPQLMRTMGVRTPGGELRWILVNSRPRLDDDGAVEGAVTSFLDVTAQRAAELRDAAARERLAATVRDLAEGTERLRTTQQQLRTIIDRSPIGMGITATDGTILDVNDAYAEIVGRPRDQLLGRRRSLFTHPDEQPLERRLLERVLAGETDSYRLEKRYVRPDGTHVWVQADIAAIRDADGRVRTLVGQIQDITGRRDRDARLVHLADHDPLTELLNRRGLDRALRTQAEHARRYGTGGGVLLIDLDGFKTVNDTLGHDAGDEVLVRVARALREHVRSSDVVARLGGDEFAVVLPEGDEDAVRSVAAALSTLLDGRGGPDAPEDLDVTASVGFALFGDAEDPEDLLRRADRSMYDVKHRRRPDVAPGPAAAPMAD